MLCYEYGNLHDQLIFIIGIPTPGKMVFILRWGPGFWYTNNKYSVLCPTLCWSSVLTVYINVLQDYLTDTGAIFDWGNPKIARVQHQTLIEKPRINPKIAPVSVTKPRWIWKKRLYESTMMIWPQQNKAEYHVHISWTYCMICSHTFSIPDWILTQYRRIYVVFNA